MTSRALHRDGPQWTSGLAVVAWRDATARALEWFRERVAAGAGTSALGLHVLLGADVKEMFANPLRNLEEDRIRVIQGVAEAARNCGGGGSPDRSILRATGGRRSPAGVPDRQKEAP